MAAAVRTLSVASIRLVPYGVLGASLSQRNDNIEELYRLAGQCFAVRSSADWLALLAELDIPAAPVAALEDLPQDPHLQAVGFFQKADHPTEGGIMMPGFPVRFSASPGEISRLQPKLGEHSAEVLTEAGLDDQDIATLFETGASHDGRQGKGR